MLKLFFSLVFSLCLYATPVSHIVVLGDPHLPGKNMPMKEQVIEHINQWNDVSMVVAVGDLCSRAGTQEEYAFVKAYFAKLTKPLYAITGNHDFIYTDELDGNGKFQHASKEIQDEKLKRFQAIFGLSKLYYSVEKAPYLLIFLSADDPQYLTKLSDEQFRWFEHELQTHSKTPTIVFFHAPLDHTLDNYNHWANTPNFIAQPKEKLHQLILNNPQLFLWVSGHTHTSAKEPSYASAINRVEHVTNIHNADMNKENIWTNSLFLYDNNVTIKTYDHTEKKWLNALERTIFIPKF
ncbi:metallophosphoesterase family protein [Sulfurospirillum oryzae]|uniref:metallophosphoesterase family protein n=1 Tax=Sulfurospirillum oryzae TaxID=2976535 RepID=UPI0021E984DE|nr:metallophosphoesterase [Sulfurospirillum oryzae]